MTIISFSLVFSFTFFCFEFNSMQKKRDWSYFISDLYIPHCFCNVIRTSVDLTEPERRTAITFFASILYSSENRNETDLFVSLHTRTVTQTHAETKRESEQRKGIKRLQKLYQNCAVESFQ